MATDNLLVLRGGQISLFFARLTTRAILAAFFIVVLSVVQIYRNGFTPRYLFLILSAILTVAATIAFFLLIVVDKGRKQKRWPNSLIAIGGGFIPYLFGCYLVFYEGVYRLRFLLDGFSFRIIIVACIFIILGYAIVKGIYHVSEFAKQVDEGEIVVE